MNIGKNIKKYRKERKMTQQQLADAINKSKSTIEKYEADKIKSISFDTLGNIATALQVPVDILCGLELEPFIEPLGGVILGYTDKKTGLLTLDSSEDYIKSEIAKDLVDNEFYIAINSLKTFLNYTSGINLTWDISDDKNIKIKIRDNPKGYSKVLNEKEALSFIDRIKFHIMAEINYMAYKDAQKEIKETLKKMNKEKNTNSQPK